MGTRCFQRRVFWSVERCFGKWKRSDAGWPFLLAHRAGVVAPRFPEADAQADLKKYMALPVKAGASRRERGRQMRADKPSAAGDGERSFPTKTTFQDLNLCSGRGGPQGFRDYLFEDFTNSRNVKLALCIRPRVAPQLDAVFRRIDHTDDSVDEVVWTARIDGDAAAAIGDDPAGPVFGRDQPNLRASSAKMAKDLSWYRKDPGLRLEQNQQNVSAAKNVREVRKRLIRHDIEISQAKQLLLFS